VKPTRTLEIEIKLRVTSPAEARRRLRRAGFRVRKRRVRESNTLFDTPGQALRRAGAALRIRQAGNYSTLTYKGPGKPGRYKSREELEIEIGDAVTAARILSRLGFEPAFRYEKHRTEYAGRNARGIVTLDETKVGCFLELEGPPRWIDQTRRALGFEASEAITASYIELYLNAGKKAAKTAGLRL
jgi:adenylate cyclase class 2